MNIRQLVLVILLAAGLMSCSEEVEISTEVRIATGSDASTTVDIEAILHEHIAVLASDEYEGKVQTTGI